MHKVFIISNRMIELEYLGKYTGKYSQHRYVRLSHYIRETPEGLDASTDKLNMPAEHVPGLD